MVNIDNVARIINPSDMITKINPLELFVNLEAFFVNKKLLLLFSGGWKPAGALVES